LAYWALRALLLFYCDQYDLPLPEGHKFPLIKYRLLRESLAAGDTARHFDLQPAPLITRDDLVRIHDPHYVDSFLTGSNDPRKMRRIGFPWSPGLVQRSLASVGGTLAATRAALWNGLAGTLAGGTHHAFRAEGSGFCVFHDMAVACAWVLAHTVIQRIAIVDLDVHQGDGTAWLFEGDSRIFSLSLHGARNFPFRKQRSSLDIEFPDATSDEDYVEALNRALMEVWRFQPELVFFQSGVDALASDQLGRLRLTRAGLAARDRMVIGSAVERGMPLVITLGGGYSRPIQATVEAHEQTFRIAASYLQSVKLITPNCLLARPGLVPALDAGSE
jgi:acetoin utilization deacetylase AcuC-like enzyme